MSSCQREDLPSEQEDERPYSQMSKPLTGDETKKCTLTGKGSKNQSSKNPKPQQSQSPDRHQQSPSPPICNSPVPSFRRSPSPCLPASSPSPILTRPGSANRRFVMGRTTSVSFLDQDDEDDDEDSGHEDSQE